MKSLLLFLAPYKSNQLECVSPVWSGCGWTVRWVENLCVVERTISSWGWRGVQDLQTQSIWTLFHFREKSKPCVSSIYVCLYLGVEGSFGRWWAAGWGASHMVPVIERSPTTATTHKADWTHHGLPAGNTCEPTIFLLEIPHIWTMTPLLLCIWSYLGRCHAESCWGK